MSGEERYFKKQLEAVAFLQESGFKISKSKFNRDFNAGLIPCTSDKQFSSRDLLAYAKSEVSPPIPAAERKKTSPKKKGRPKKAWAALEGPEQIERLLSYLPEPCPDSSLLTLFQIDIEESRETPPTQKAQSPRNVYRNRKETPARNILPKQGIYDDVTHVDFSYPFCFTGIFAFGERPDCEQATAERGGTVTRYPIKNNCYLVVGTFASPDWSHVNYGSKIDRALGYKKSGGSICIISEDVWANAIVG